MDISNNVTKLEVNFFEYCIVEEKTYLPAETVKVKVPKLTTNTNNGTVYPNKTILINDTECKPETAGSIKLVPYCSINSLILGILIISR